MSSENLAPPLAGKVLGSVANDFLIAEWDDPGGPSEQRRLIAPLHLHHRDDEAWYVLEGILCLQRGEEVIELRAGSAALVPRGVAHTYWNPGPGPARYLLTMTPRIYRLIEAIHALEDRSPAVLARIFAEHDSVLL